MANSALREVITQNPIGHSLDGIRTSFENMCGRCAVPRTPEALDHFGQRDSQQLIIQLLTAFKTVITSRSLSPDGWSERLLKGLTSLTFWVTSDDAEIGKFKRLLGLVASDKPDNEAIWTELVGIVFGFPDTSRNRSGIVDSSLEAPRPSIFANSCRCNDCQDVVIGIDRDLFLSLAELPSFRSRFQHVRDLKGKLSNFYDHCLEPDKPTPS